MTPVEKSERERELQELARKAGEAGYCNIPALMEYLSAAFEAGRSAGEAGWISVEERLPPEGHIVLTYSTDKNIDTAWLCDAETWYLERTQPQDETITYRVRDGQVTHWHELPNPPEAGPIADKGDGNAD